LSSFLYDRAADVVRWIYDWRIDGSPVLELEGNFPGGRRFVEAWREIRSEALRVAGNLEQVPRFHEIMPEQAPISANDGRDWRLFIIKAYGVVMAGKAEACPRLAALVDECPDVLSASISFLAPGKHIPPHRGPFRGVLRFYLPLLMPLDEDGLPAAILKLAGAEHRVAEGDCLLWDDTYTHEVWNASRQMRIVLLLDVWRPRMPADMRLLSHTLVATARAGIRLRGLV